MIENIFTFSDNFSPFGQEGGEEGENDGGKHPTNSLINCKLLPLVQLLVVQREEEGDFWFGAFILKSFAPPPPPPPLLAQ